ncbi:MAG: PHB depolymerase family esterase [Armatimonadota bacterium]|nr:esterase [bacterium]MDW8321466.1 PHB depolymerase family esterase [Armatimonadota bacterium]
MFQQAENLTLQVEGVQRTALVYAGTESQRQPSPLVLVFHGFSGSAHAASRKYSLHTAWKEAIVAYPQGLTVQSRRLLRYGPGWQHYPGEYEDRDLKFVDALLTQIKSRHRVDEKRVYACGMSNGARFCFVLLTERPQPFAAFAPVAGTGASFLWRARTPRPVLMINGKADSTVSFRTAERTRDLLRRLNGCGNEEKEWAKGYVTYLPVKDDNHVVFYAHDGGHIWPSGATEHIVRFFKEHRLR